MTGLQKLLLFRAMKNAVSADKNGQKGVNADDGKTDESASSLAYLPDQEGSGRNGRD